MLQIHSTKPVAEQDGGCPGEPRSGDPNVTAWLLLGSIRSLLQENVEQPTTVRWLRTTLAELMPALREILENGFLSGAISDPLHASVGWTSDPDGLLKSFRDLVETLDELSIRLEWNLPVEEVVPFADLRVARWIAEVSSFWHAKSGDRVPSV